MTLWFRRLTICCSEEHLWVSEVRTSLLPVILTLLDYVAPLVLWNAALS